MHKTDAANNVGNEFSDGTPPLTPGTSLGAKWHNTIQRELVNVVLTKAGIALDDGDDTQLGQALDVLYGRLAAANTWTDDQTFSGAGKGVDITASDGLYVQNNVLIDGNLSVGDVVNPSILQAMQAVSLTLSSFLRVTGATRLTGGVESATAATASTPQTALEMTNGYLKLSGAMPNSDVGMAGLLGPNSFAKAHCVVDVVSGTPTVQGKGKNIASVSIVTVGGSDSALRVTFTNPMAAVWYTAIPAIMTSSTILSKTANVYTLNANYCDIVAFSNDSIIDLSASSAVISLVVLGE